MTVKAMKSMDIMGMSVNETKSETAFESIPRCVVEIWESFGPDIRAALVLSELNTSDGENTKTTETSVSNGPSHLSRSRSDSLSDQNSSISSARDNDQLLKYERCPVSGARIILSPVDRAPENVFAFTKTYLSINSQVTKTSNSTVTTTTEVVSTSRGWRNVFTLPISYDVNVVAHGTLFDPMNSQLLDATGVRPEGYNTCFSVVDYEVNRLYGDKIRNYFNAHGLELHVCIINGGEADKRPEAVDYILNELCAYKLRRREPFLAIGGGCVLDIAGMAACLYRRGVPFVRVPTTLLAIVDASVGVKNGVDYCCGPTNSTYKNRIGSFYAPAACLLDPAFIASQDRRNVSNGLGEILKLALVRSLDLFDLLEAHGNTLVESRFEDPTLKQSGISSRIIDLSIQIMLEELGPNLWESKLDRCVDYGHTFSKLLEMVPGADIMHGEAVNIDGFLCVMISYIRGYINMGIVDRIFNCMKSLSLPTISSHLNVELALQSCKDAIEHRHGEQRIPLITDIGESICVSDITEEELRMALDLLKKFDHETLTD